MAGKKREKGKNPGSMAFFMGGVTAGRLRELILDYADEHGLTPQEATARYLEWAATRQGAFDGNKRATYAKGVSSVRVFYHGREWPKKE